MKKMTLANVEKVILTKYRYENFRHNIILRTNLELSI